jgi:shikimate kinase
MRPNDAAAAQPAGAPSESADAAAGERIVLMGMMGAGKTTVGRLVAERLGCPYLDNDGPRYERPRARGDQGI